jgi:sugar phosphate isomerase/epimerase
MKLGLSLYSIDREIAQGRMTLATAIEWAAAQGAECVELVPFSYKFERDDGSIDFESIALAKRAAKDAGIPLVNYSVPANLIEADASAFEAEIQRTQRHVQIAAELGLPRMRHDISSFSYPRDETGVEHFERLFPRMVEAVTRIAAYAQTLGVTTMLENHGFFVNGCDRCERLVRAVNRDNYKFLLDTGNMICVDEDAEAAAWKLAPMAEMIHLKDFYIRRRNPSGDGSWFQSNMGRYLRGSIVGQGDMDMYEIIGQIKKSGYDGNIAIEFEGFEEPAYASKVSLDNARRIWDEV